MAQTLPEMLEWAKGKAILVLDRKDIPIEARIRMVEDHKAEACAIVCLMIHRFFI